MVLEGSQKLIWPFCWNWGSEKSNDSPKLTHASSKYLRIICWWPGTVLGHGGKAAASLVLAPTGCAQGFLRLGRIWQANQNGTGSKNSISLVSLSKWAELPFWDFAASTRCTLNLGLPSVTGGRRCWALQQHHPKLHSVPVSLRLQRIRTQ